MNIKRMRGRSRYNNHGPSSGRNNGSGVPLNKNYVFDSNGPDVRIRGTAQQLYEKYLQMGRDSTAGDDRIMAESYFQYAEHYFRVWGVMNQGQENRPLYRSEEEDEGAVSASDKNKEEAKNYRPKRRAEFPVISEEAGEEAPAAEVHTTELNEEEKFSASEEALEKTEDKVKENKKTFHNVKLSKATYENRAETERPLKSGPTRRRSERNREETENRPVVASNESSEKLIPSQGAGHRQYRTPAEFLSEAKTASPEKNAGRESDTEADEAQGQEGLPSIRRLRSVRRSMRRSLRGGASTQQPLLTHSDD